MATITLHKNIRHQVRKAARKQIRAMMPHADDDTEETVHRLRVGCKKMRAFLHLIRPSLRSKSLYRRQKGFYREIARDYAAGRDHIVLDTLITTLLEEGYPDDPAITALQRTFSEPHADAHALDEQFERTCRQLKAAAQSVNAFRLKKKGRKAFKPGLKSGYRTARKRGRTVLNHPDDASIHEWRKSVKRHLYQMKLLWKNGDCHTRRYVDGLDELASILGDDHDLAMLKLHTKALEGVSTTRLLETIAARQRQLRRRAKRIHSRLFCQRPKQFVATAYREFS
jgi:CHAD domain-containing protein